ncbi:CGNR zinc finger domain-containing protein [Pseudonocardia acaciae]|uniref:CGNR zinc finger domain-containing protein n=1 Tax=Pseudonocardia acaciae TaxID=551276 RepID=UPI000685927D|nr:ABATE domain-containing protein [Pseudonocardia acaciae]
MAPRKADLSGWLFTAGRLSLDFLGTVGHRPAEHVERLTDPAALRRWLLEAGLPAQRLAPTDGDLAAAREVREALYGLIAAQVDGAPPGGDVALLNRVASVAPPSPSVTAGRVGAVVEWSRPAELSPLLSVIVRDGMDLVGGELIGRVRRCDAPDCRKLFLDTGPRPRRWCSAAACGTRHRVAAHRATRRTPPAQGPGPGRSRRAGPAPER